MAKKSIQRCTGCNALLVSFQDMQSGTCKNCRMGSGIAINERPNTTSFKPPKKNTAKYTKPQEPSNTTNNTYSSSNTPNTYNSSNAPNSSAPDTYNSNNTYNSPNSYDSRDSYDVHNTYGNTLENNSHASFEGASNPHKTYDYIEYANFGCAGIGILVIFLLISQCEYDSDDSFSGGGL